MLLVRRLLPFAMMLGLVLLAGSPRSARAQFTPDIPTDHPIVQPPDPDAAASGAVAALPALGATASFSDLVHGTRFVQWISRLLVPAMRLSAIEAPARPRVGRVLSRW